MPPFHGPPALVWLHCSCQHFGTQSSRPLLCIPSVLRTLCVPFIWSDPHINQIAWLTSNHRLFTAKAKGPNMWKSTRVAGEWVHVIQFPTTKDLKVGVPVTWVSSVILNNWNKYLHTSGLIWTAYLSQWCASSSFSGFFLPRVWSTNSLLQPSRTSSMFSACPHKPSRLRSSLSFNMSLYLCLTTSPTEQGLLPSCMPYGHHIPTVVMFQANSLGNLRRPLPPMPTTQVEWSMPCPALFLRFFSLNGRCK